MIDDVNRRLDEGTARMNRYEAKIDANSADTAEVLNILRLGKSFFRLADGLARFIKWTLALAVPIAVLWYTIKNGGKP